MQSVRDGHLASDRQRVTAERLDAVLDRAARRHRVPGAQLAVLRDGERVVVQTGVEDQDRGTPMTEDSAVPSGSVTKVATATVVMVLVADDDLELDQPVGDALGVAGLDRGLTPRRLLSHTSGLPSDPADP
ncbi:serine hydrolase domain-containing protein, partial [Amycolatopsis sp. SID8362]|uniref:serine hydrolase domain-containing protein n=1 Tax=Amycolatopsis sp. SID8362 TaxID=2690346 RepID=UPI00136C25BE